MTFTKIKDLSTFSDDISVRTLSRSAPIEADYGVGSAQEGFSRVVLSNLDEAQLFFIIKACAPIFVALRQMRAGEENYEISWNVDRVLYSCIVTTSE